MENKIVFSIKGIDGEISLVLKEIYGYPSEVMGARGFAASGVLKLKAGGYFIETLHSFFTGEILLFKDALQTCYDNLSGLAILNNSYHELNMQVSFDKRGNVHISGTHQERLDVNNKLTFIIQSEQSYITETLKSLQKFERMACVH